MFLAEELACGRGVCRVSHVFSSLHLLLPVTAVIVTAGGGAAAADDDDDGGGGGGGVDACLLTPAC